MIYLGAVQFSWLELLENCWNLSSESRMQRMALPIVQVWQALLAATPQVQNHAAWWKQSFAAVRG